MEVSHLIVTPRAEHRMRIPRTPFNEDRCSRGVDADHVSAYLFDDQLTDLIGAH